MIIVISIDLRSLVRYLVIFVVVNYATNLTMLHVVWRSFLANISRDNFLLLPPVPPPLNPRLSSLGSPPWSYSYLDQSKPKQVQVNMFYKSHCPDSKNLIVHTLSTIYSLLTPRMSITLDTTHPHKLLGHFQKA